MTIHDFRNLDPEIPIDADVCIVGSGPAGWTVAEELRDSGLRVLVLESGGALESGAGHLDPEAEALNDIEDVGVPRFRGRLRTLGGTPEKVPWGNRCIAFEDIDYEARPWVPFSGWPVGREAFAPYLDRASKHLGAGPYLGDEHAPPPAPRGVTRLDVDPTQLRNIWWNFGRQGKDTIRYARLFRQRRHENLRVIVHATVTHLNTNASGNRIESIEVSDLEEKRATIKTRNVVLCAGGIENPRILLYSNRVIPNGVGNTHDLVGRFLMDHPRDLKRAVTIDPEHVGKIHRHFGPYFFDNGDGGRKFVGGLALSPDVQRREELLNCAAWPFEEWLEQDPIGALRRLKRRDLTDAGKDIRLVAANTGMLLRSFRSYAVHRQPVRMPCKRAGFIIGSEQRPDPDSRVTLTDKLGPLGLPVARTDWRIHEQDRASQAMLAKTLQKEFRRLALPEAHLADWMHDGRHEEAVMSDGCHPTGTTRMATDPRAGVVDADCQVHGVDGLYIASSSVFPTAGHANPTLMIVALAARLAHHLKEQLSKGDRIRTGVEAGAPTFDDEIARRVDSREVLARSALTGVTAS